MKKLAILIPTLSERELLLKELLKELERQIAEANAEISVITIIAIDQRQSTTGKKRNELVAKAVEKGCYAVASLDDDDKPGPTYIKRGIEFMESGMDCAELWGQIYFNGKPGNPFHHFIDCLNPVTGKIEWWQDEKYYYRMPNHLNFQKLSLMKDIPFPDQVFGEDGKQSEAMRDAGIFKTMYPIPEVIYHYYCGEPKHAT